MIFGNIVSKQNHSLQLLAFLYPQTGHSMKLMDPDVRAGLAAHPRIHVVDNHDVGDDFSTLESNPGLRVFEMWTPVRWKRYNDSNGLENFQLYRHIRFGKIAELVALDTRPIGEPEGLYLGSEQRAYLKDEVFEGLNGTESWFLIASGRAFTAWRMDGIQAYVSGLYFGVFLLPSGIGLITCLMVRRRQIKEQLSLEDTDDRGLDHYTNSSQGDKDLKSEVKCKQSKSVHVHLRKCSSCCYSCCGRKRCLILGCVIVLFLLIGYVFLILKINNVLEIQQETGVINPFAHGGNWDGYPIDRAEFMKDLVDAGATDNNIFLSG